MVRLRHWLCDSTGGRVQAAEKAACWQKSEAWTTGLCLKPAGAFDSDIVIDRVLPGSPSATAGLLKGDRTGCLLSKSLIVAAC